MIMLTVAQGIVMELLPLFTVRALLELGWYVGKKEKGRKKSNKFFNGVSILSS